MTTFVTRDTICLPVKLNVLLGGGGETMEAYETCFWTTCCLRLGPCMQDSLCSWRHEVPYNLRTLAFFCLCLDSFWVNTFLVFGTVWCLVPETLALKKH